MANQKANIIIVEDEAIVAEEIKTSLEGMGYFVTSIVKTGESAIEKAEQDRPDVILMDIRLEGQIDGIEAAERIRSRFDIPVIFLTAYTEQHMLERAKVIEPFGYILKPYRKRDLRVTIEMALYKAKIDVARMRAEEALRYSEERYRTLFDQAPIMYIITRNQDYLPIVEDCNQIFLSTLGYSWSEVVGQPLTDFYTPESCRDLLRGGYLRTLEGRFIPEERGLLTRDGDVIETVLHAFPETDSNELVWGARAMYVDITERKQAEVALKKAHDELKQRVEERTLELKEANKRLIFEIEERKQAEAALKKEHEFLNAVLNNIEDGIVACNSEGILNLFNRATRELHGLPEKPIPADQWAQHYDLYLSDGKKKMKTEDIPLFRALQGEQVRNVEMVIAPKDGKARTVLASGQPLFDSRGNKTGAVVSMHDITKRKLAAQELQKNKNMLQSVFDGISEPLVMLDKDMKIKMLNRAAMTYYKVENPDSLSDKPCYQALRGELKPCEGCNIPSVVTAGRPTTLEREGFMDPERYEELYFYPLEETLGGEGAVILRINDITEKKTAADEKRKMRGQLQQAQKMEAIGTLAGGIAHDFNNILGAIIGHGEIMELFEVPEGHEMRSSLKEVLNSAYRAKDLVEQILTFSRQSQQEKKTIRLIQIIKEALRLLRASLPSIIEIRQDIDNIAGTVIADPTQMHQVLMNLCTNASHAMREKGGVLEVSLTAVNVGAEDVQLMTDLEPGPYIRLDVRDTGHGMAPEIMGHIFDPYYTTKGKGEGTGLGLSMVHGIVKNHQGAITVESRLGEGSTFHVFLPLKETKSAEQEVKQLEPLPIGKGCILFVDDEKPLVSFGKEILEHLGYEAVVRTSSVEALEAFTAQPERFDLVITDITMPNMTGLELAKAIIRTRPELPIILCTGFSETVTAEAAKAAGVKEFIQKPIGARRLAETIQRVLGKND